MRFKKTELPELVIHERQHHHFPISTWTAWKALRKKYAKHIYLARRSVGPRIVFCRPQGGFNDSLVQISKCFSYAINYGRRLIVDTSRSGLLDVLENYFYPSFLISGIHFSIPSGFSETSAKVSCYPHCLNGRGINYKSQHSDQTNYVETMYNERLTFDFNKKYNEEILIHEQCGGGTSSIEFFDWAAPTRAVKKEINSRLKSAPQSYIALHIRHTDRKTRYTEFLAAAKPLIRGANVLICTDSYEVLSYARKFLDTSRTYSISNIPDSHGQSLHHNTELTNRSTNMGALCDLAAMSRAKAIIHPTAAFGYRSGFVDLAVSLMQRPALA